MLSKTHKPLLSRAGLIMLALSILIAGMVSCNSNASIVVTVNGPVKTSRLGRVLPHEHILVDFIGADSTGYHRWDRPEVYEKALPFLREVRELGCETFIECTPAYLGRDPLLLKMLADSTGLNILTNTGLYGAFGNKFIPERAREMTAEELAREWISEFHEGIENTGIRPGFIKIAVDRDDTLSAMHEKIVRAAGLTHLETGLAIKSHTGPDRPAFNQLAVLEGMGVPAGAFIWTHAQSGSLQGWIDAADKGAWISIDNIRSQNIDEHLENLKAIKAAGFLDRVLISHDSGWYRVGQPDGGQFNGYTAIFREFIPALKASGFTDEEIRQLTVLNPARAFGISNPKHGNP